MKIEDKKKFSEKWFEYLQDQICDSYESIEKKFGGSQKFLATKWSKSKQSEGGGNYRILKAGKVFDKVGVNKSTVSGKFSKKFRANILGAQKDGNYWASGISVVAHMKNPKIPAMHFNTRFIVTKKSWFGGGIDLTPSFKDKKEEIYFHSKLKELCNNNKKNYNFFDYEKKNWEKDFQFVREVGIGFIELSSHIIKNKIKLKYNKRDKEIQYLKRGRYIEFNLLYDRGTKFGLNSGGNTEAILMSLPPKAKW